MEQCKAPVGGSWNPGECTLDKGHIGSHDDKTPWSFHHHPGDNHVYEIICKVCGQIGMLNISVTPPTSEVKDV